MSEYPRTESTYTDDVVAVMRDTIAALRELVAAKDATITELRAAVRAAGRTIAACPSCRSVR